MREHPIGNLLVVFSQLTLGDSLAGIENAIGMGELDAGNLHVVLGTRCRRFFLVIHVLSNDLCRRFVLT